jgi:hypothetical protein
MPCHAVHGRVLRVRVDDPQDEPPTPEALAALVVKRLGNHYKAIDTNACTSRLVGLRGEIAEKRGRDDDALAAYEEALDMNRALLQQALTGANP